MDLVVLVLVRDDRLATPMGCTALMSTEGAADITRELFSNLALLTYSWVVLKMSSHVGSTSFPISLFSSLSVSDVK
eukprot:maker-scaffold178_size283195-snap-gene-1.36 protein:Tk10262 transcript:maker-scaffold178_size283195-snap-gene-1.36-mRNA-1 annotation:"hypothetical protein"